MRSSVKVTTDPAIVQCKWCHYDWSGLVSQKCDGDKDARRVPCTSDVTQRDTCRTIIQGSVPRAPAEVVDTTCSMQNNSEYITTGCATRAAADLNLNAGTQVQFKLRTGTNRSQSAAEGLMPDGRDRQLTGAVVVPHDFQEACHGVCSELGRTSPWSSRARVLEVGRGPTSE